jgi:hypothetical protein
VWDASLWDQHLPEGLLYHQGDGGSSEEEPSDVEDTTANPFNVQVFGVPCTVISTAYTAYTAYTVVPLPMSRTPINCMSEIITPALHLNTKTSYKTPASPKTRWGPNGGMD